MLYHKQKKHKQKTKHVSNKRISEYIECECGKAATVTHEWFNGAFRSKSIQYKAQIQLCDECHRRYHDSKLLWIKHQRKHQLRIMLEERWSLSTWLENFGKNYLSDSELTFIQTEILRGQHT